MRTIYTKYIPASGTKGPRISAKDTMTGKRVVIPFDHTLFTIDNHLNAFLELVKQLMAIDEKFVVGHANRGYVFVQSSGDFSMSVENGKWK
jgi:hypothetical protein